MTESLKFANVETHLNTIIGAILGNEDFRKYVIYLIDNPLSESVVPSEEDVMRDVILPMPFNDKLLKDNVTVFIYPGDMSFGGSAIGNFQFVIDIVIPNEFWLLPGMAKLRVFRIADEISKSIDQKRIAGVHENVITRAKPYSLSREFSGMTMTIPVTSNALKGLR